MNRILGESTFWYYVARRTNERISIQIHEPVELMNREAGHLDLPVRWRAERSVLWATACQLYLISKQKIGNPSQFTAFQRGAAAVFQQRTFFEHALTRVIDNVSEPALPNRSPADSVADTYAVAGLEYEVPDAIAEKIHDAVCTEVVTNTVIHSAALLAVSPDGDLWPDYLEEYQSRQPSWLRRMFTDSDTWLFDNRPSSRV